MSAGSTTLHSEARDAAGRPVDVAGFAGRWISSNEDTRGIPRIDLEVGDAGLRFRAFGTGPGATRIDWGWQPMECLLTDGPDSATGAGFLAAVDHGFLTSRLQVNLKLGVAVVCAFHRFTDGSGRRPHFWREFMARHEVAPPRLGDPDLPLACLKDHDSGTFDSHGAVDISTLAGRWRNTQVSAGVSYRVSEIEVDIEVPGRRDDGETGDVSVRVVGADSQEWGTALGTAHLADEEDEQDSAAVLACYEFDRAEAPSAPPARTVELQIRQNKGILAVTFFYRFGGDGGGSRPAAARRDFVLRELFHRLPSQETAPS